MTLSQQIRELAGKVEQTYQEGQNTPGGIVADNDMLREYIYAKTGMRDLMIDNLPTILSALELAERLEAPGCVEEVARALEKVMSTGNEPRKIAAQAAISAMKGEKG